MSNRDLTYFDEMGNRTKLDTRHLQWCSDHKLQDLRGKRVNQEREEKVNFIVGIIKFFSCIFCLWFAFVHCDVILHYAPQIAEAAGVIACLAFVASCLTSLFEKWNDK